MTALLPLGKTQFTDQNGVPLAGGSVGFYIPGTTTPKLTYQAAGPGAPPNTNPVVLDSAGRATIWGEGSYRQILQDVNGATIWDQVIQTGNGSPNYSVADYGAAGDGVADDTAAILACQAAVVAAGGGTVYYPPGTYAISQTIVVNASSVHHVGAGRGGNHDSNPVVTAASKLLWIGANGGTMMRIAPLVNAQKLVDWKVADLALVSGVYPYTTAAAYGILISCCFHGKLCVTTIEFTAAAIATTCDVALQESVSVQFNNFDIIARQINTTGTVLQMGGGMGGNSAFNRIVRLAAEYSGIGIDLQDADNNTFDEVYLQYNGQGVGQSLYLRGQTVAGGGFARNNVFIHYSHSVESSQIFAEGIGTYGPRVVIGPSMQNQILFYDAANANENVFLGYGASFFIGKNTQPIGINDSYVSDPTGYVADNTGLYEVWGQTAPVASGGSVAVTFPNSLQLPNNVFFSVFASGAALAPYSITNGSRTGFTLTVGTYTGAQAGQSYAWNWRAWGR